MDNQKLLDRCKIIAEAYASVDPEPYIDALAEDCVYESQQSFTPIKGKDAIEESIRKWFNNIKESKNYVTSSVRRVFRGPVMDALGQPCVVLKRDDAGLVLLLKLSDDSKISRIDVCVVPAPTDTRPLDEEGRFEVTSLKPLVP